MTQTHLTPEKLPFSLHEDFPPCRVAVLMGGISNERSVSLSSGEAVFNALTACGHHVKKIIIEQDIIKNIEAITSFAPDVAFNALHGSYGEDGHIQAILNWLKIPYTHSNLLSSAIAMDKAATRLALQAASLPIAHGMVLTPQDLLKKGDPLPRPYVIKPLSEGSSVGVHLLFPHGKELASIVENWCYGSHLLVEEFIPGHELTVGVLNDCALGVTEILPEREEGFYDFDAKYKIGGSRHLLPANLPPHITQTALKIAVDAHQALSCSGASRTDFRFDPKTERLIILEVNTQPGMTPTSLLPEQAAWRGISYQSLCHWMVAQAARSSHLP